MRFHRYRILDWIYTESKRLPARQDSSHWIVRVWYAFWQWVMYIWHNSPRWTSHGWHAFWQWVLQVGFGRISPIIFIIGFSITWILVLNLVKPASNPSNISVATPIGTSSSTSNSLKASTDLPGPFTNIGDISLTLTLSISVAFVAVIIYFIFWHIINAPKHIIRPFDSGIPELEPFASKATGVFADHVRAINTLLSSRQVENVSNRPDNPMAVFITSGQDPERLKELPSSISIEASGIKLSLDGFLSFITFNMAETRIRGNIQKRQDGGLDISIEMVQQNGRTLTASRVINVNGTTGLITDSEFTGKLKDLAIEVVMELGRGNRLASSWENMRNFLDGLDASMQRNWWHAITLYRHTIQREESARGEAGLGHYHLGSMLVSQGEPSAGLKHLRIAEVSGFSLPDTQYMIALTLFYMHQNDLHKNKSNANPMPIPNSKSFSVPKTSEFPIYEIALHCNRALALRHDFPEVHHLLGAAYYQVGKLRDRDKDKVASTYYYNQAVENLKKAIKQYAKQIDRLSNDGRAQHNKMSVERERLIKNYITATNRLAAALRSLEKFTEAEQYYLEVLEASPANIQTLSDLAKTYCLYKKWSKVENLFKREVFYLEDAVWNVDVSFYRGWALAGGLKKMQGENSLRQFGKALQYLDYALYQRPRFISSWRQTKWEIQFKDAAGILTQGDTKRINPSINDATERYILQYDANWAFHIDTWLAWRRDSFADVNTEPKHHTSLLELPISFDQYPFPELGEAYRDLKSLRNKTKKLLQSIDDAENIGGVRNHWIRLTWAQNAYKTWEKVDQVTIRQMLDEGFRTKPFEFTFDQRWAIDVYAEIAMLACRLLAECRAYEHLYTIANHTSESLDQWLKYWQDQYGSGDEDFRFSSRVLGHQIASCYAWKAYALLQQNNNPETRIRIRASKQQHQNYLYKCQEAIKKAFEHRPLHPLAIYVQAQIYRTNKLYRLAIDELTHLLLLVEPFDPKTFYTNTEERLAARTPQESTEERIHYYYMERVSGLQQFEDFIDRTRIHMELAELFSLENEFKSSSDHYLMALTWSPYKDMDVKNLLRLANQLYRLSRFDEAFSVVQEIHVRRTDTLLASSSVTKGQEAQIMECILYTRLDDFYSALERGLTLSKALPKPSFKNLIELFPHLNGQDELKEYFEKAGYSDEEVEILNPVGPKRGLKTCFDTAAQLIGNKLENPDDEKKLQDISHSLKQIADGLFLTPDESLLRGVLLLDVRNMSKLLEKKIPSASKRNLVNDVEKFRVMVSHLLQFICKKALNALIHEAEIANNIAYNQAELRIDLDKAEQRSRYSIAIFEFIADCIGDQDDHSFIENRKGERIETNSLDGVHIKESEVVGDNTSRSKVLKSAKNYREKYGDAISGQEIAEKLALYYDTLGWIYYRRGKGFEHAETYLQTALQYNANIMTTHYHLARVFLTLFEQLWQSDDKTDNEFNGKASGYLRDSFYYLNKAQQLGGITRIESKILLLKGKIQKYREHWDKVQLTLERKNSKRSD